MSDRENRTQVKVCNHKPGDKWDDGCCGDEAVRKLQVKGQRSEVKG